jgi:hypothetical protein
LLSISLVSSNTTVTSESLRVGKFSGAVRGWKAWQQQLCDGAADVTRRLSDTVISHISLVVRDDVYQSLEISRQARKVCSSSELVEASAGPSRVKKAGNIEKAQERIPDKGLAHDD